MRRFIGHDGGTTAIEFALVFPAFAALVFITLEIGMVVYGKSMADRAARAAANELRVTAGLSDVQLRAKVCEMASPVLSCDDHLTVSKDAVVSPADTSGGVTVQTVEVSYRWPVYFPTTAALLADPGHDYRTLRAVGVSAADTPAAATGGLVW